MILWCMVMCFHDVERPVFCAVFHLYNIKIGIFNTPSPLPALDQHYCDMSDFVELCATVGIRIWCTKKYLALV